MKQMRILVISDIHANLAAFRAVLRDSKSQRDGIICLGDLVGYGPDPNECVEVAAESCTVALGGNHDLAAADQVDMSVFSSHARKAMDWTRSVLTESSRNYLAGLVPKTQWEGITLSHGGPEDPVWSYIFSEADALFSFVKQDFSRCFFGHTHIPSAFILNTQDRGRRRCTALYGKPNMAVKTEKPGTRLLLNPGSTGFPRDAADGSAALYRSAARYAIFDTAGGSWLFKSVRYDMRDTAGRMMKAGLWD
jgi:predicted phosphodiesterase